MKRVVLLGLLLAGGVQAETMAITGTDVWTNTTDAPVKNATIIVTDGRIVSIDAGDAVSQHALPAGARVVNAAGKFVTPPLDAAATQIGLVETASASDTDDRSVSSGSLGAAFDVSLGVDANELSVQQARAAGVRRALVFPSAAGNGIFAGQGARLGLDRTGDIVDRPRAAMFVVAGGGAAKVAGGSRAAMWGLLRNALEEARQAHGGSAGPYKPRDQLLNHADLEALMPVLERREPLAIVANREADIRQALAVAHDEGVSLVIVGGAEAWRVADLLAARHVPVVLDPLDELPVSFDALGSRRDNAALLAKAGVLIAFSVSGQTIYLSYNVGPALREGAGIAVANGLSYAEALRAITQNPARIWNDPAAGGVGAQGAVAPGTLAPGGAADLVVWDGDPLQPSSAPALILVRGHEISLQTRQTLLRDRYRPTALP